MEYHKETDGEKGVKSDVDSIMDYVKEHFPSTAKTDRRKFAERCLSSAGIQQDIENKDNAQWATVLKENFNGEVVNDGSMDTRGNIGIALRRGRRSDEISAYIKMAESLISYYQEDPNNIPSHYYIGSYSPS